MTRRFSDLLILMFSRSGNRAGAHRVRQRRRRHPGRRRRLDDAELIAKRLAIFSPGGIGGGPFSQGQPAIAWITERLAARFAVTFYSLAQASPGFQARGFRFRAPPAAVERAGRARRALAGAGSALCRRSGPKPLRRAAVVLGLSDGGVRGGARSARAQADRGGAAGSRDRGPAGDQLWSPRPKGVSPALAARLRARGCARRGLALPAGPPRGARLPPQGCARRSAGSGGQRCFLSRPSRRARP